MTKSLLKSESNNNNNTDVRVSVTGPPDQAPASAPVSVVVDVVNHDEPSVCSVMSNGGVNQHDTNSNVSLDIYILFVTIVA